MGAPRQIPAHRSDGGANLGRLRRNPRGVAFTGVDLLAGTSLMRGPWSRTLVISTDHKETRPTEQPQHFFGATGTDPLQRPLPFPPRIALGTVAWGGALKTEMEEQHHDTSAVGDRCVEHCARLLGDHNERRAGIEHV